MAAKCERCGKFVADKSWAHVWYGDQTGGEVRECRWCMSPADVKRYLDGGESNGD